MRTNKWLHRILTVALLAVSTLTLTACETMEGMGKDVEKGGEKIQDAAEDSKK